MKETSEKFQIRPKIAENSESLLVCCEKISTGSIHENTLSKWLHFNLKSATLVIARPSPLSRVGSERAQHRIRNFRSRGKEKKSEKKEKKKE